MTDWLAAQWWQLHRVWFRTQLTQSDDAWWWHLVRLLSTAAPWTALSKSFVLRALCLSWREPVIIRSFLLEHCNIISSARIFGYLQNCLPDWVLKWVPWYSFGNYFAAANISCFCDVGFEIENLNFCSKSNRIGIAISMHHRNDFVHIWYNYFWYNLPSNDYLSFHLSQNMLLHYLGNHNTWNWH